MYFFFIYFKVLNFFSILKLDFKDWNELGKKWYLTMHASSYGLKFSFLIFLLLLFTKIKYYANIIFLHKSIYSINPSLLLLFCFHCLLLNLRVFFFYIIENKVTNLLFEPLSCWNLYLIRLISILTFFSYLNVSFYKKQNILIHF